MEGGSHPMSDFKIVLTNVVKEFNRRVVFEDVSFSLKIGESIAITGKNGTGKSTLSKIVAGLLSPSRGKVEYLADGKRLDPDRVKDAIGFVSPYLNMYDEFTALENLVILSRIRSGKSALDSRVEELLKLVNLWSRRDDRVGVYSSGMKQRLKYAFALLHRPRLLILDEPTSNLDSDGAEVVKTIAEEQRQIGILIVATNDKTESAWCRKRLRL